MICLTLSCTKAGSGGKCSITATVMHENKYVPFAQVYIKYNVNEFPGSDVSVYEATELANNEGIVVFDELKRGDYYLYAIGYDTVANDNVFGDEFVEIKKPGENVIVDVPAYTQ